MSRIKKIKNILSSPEFISLENSNSASSGNGPASQCTFHMYGQLVPTNVSESDMIELEQELKEPTGASTPHRPLLLMDVVLLSRECGLMIRVDKAEGLRSRMFFRKVSTCKPFDY
jgi:transmembrane E3 ubiquitin-protein ligase